MNTTQFVSFWLVTILIAAGGCGKEAVEQKKQRATPAPKVQQGLAASPLTALFAKQPVSFPKALTGLAFGMPHAEVKKKIGNFQKFNRITDQWIDPNGLRGVSLIAMYSPVDDTLSSIGVFMGEDGKGAVASAWGEPLAVKQLPDGSEQHYWLDEAAATQATLQSLPNGAQRLRITRFMNWQDILGEDPQLFGFESKSVLGIKEAEAKELFAANSPTSIGTSRMELHLPPYRFHASEANVEFRLDKGKIWEIEFSLKHAGDEKLRAEMLAAIAAKFGEAPVESGYHVVRAKPPHILWAETEDGFEFVKYSKKPKPTE